MAKKKLDNLTPEEIANLSAEEKHKLLDELEEKELKAKKKQAEAIYATKEMMERDFAEAVCDVTLVTAPNKTRVIKTRYVTQEQQREIIRVLTRLENIGAGGTGSEKEIVEEFEELSETLQKLAAELSVDEELDFEFWSKVVPFPVLLSYFIGITASWQNYIIPAGDLASFRRNI